MNILAAALTIALSVLPGTDSRTDFTAAGGTDFAFTWKYAASTQVQVYKNGALQAAGYVVNPAGARGADGLYTGGTVVFTPAPAAGTAVRVQRTLPLTQTSVWTPYSAFKAKTLEGQLDALAMKDQQMERRIVDAEAALADGAAGGNNTLVQATGAAAPRTLADHLATLPDAKVTSTGSLVQRSLADRLADIINVRDFGATGDGVTNDRTAIQAAIDAATARGGATVFFPKGVYRVSAYVVLKTGVTLQGAGIGVTVIRGEAIRQVIIANGATQFGLRDLTVTTDGTDGIYGVDIESSSFATLANVEIVGTTYLGIMVADTTDVQISNMVIRDVKATSGGTVGGTGMHIFDGSSRITVNGLIVDGVDGTGVWLDAATTGGTPHAVTDCVFNGLVVRNFGRVIAGLSGFATQGAKRCSGSGWTIGPAADPTVRQSSGIILNTDQNELPTTDCVISGVTIEKVGASAIKVLSSQRNQISNVRVLDPDGALTNYAVVFDEGTVSGGLTKPDNLDNVIDGLDVQTSGAPYTANYSRTVLFNANTVNTYRNRVENVRPGVPGDVVAYWNGANAPSTGANANVATYLDKDALTWRHSAPVRAAGFTSSDGSAGSTVTLTVKGSDGADHTITVKNGLITGTTLP